MKWPWVWRNDLETEKMHREFGKQEIFRLKKQVDLLAASLHAAHLELYEIKKEKNKMIKEILALQDLIFEMEKGRR